MDTPAEPDEPPVAFCAATGKVRHPSRKVATENRNRVLRGLDRSGKDRKERGVLLVFRCRDCSGWHCGNQDRFMSDRAKQRRRPRTGPDLEDEAA